MRLSLSDLEPLGEDAQQVHFIDTAVFDADQPRKVGVAVSGGGDSMALLHLAHVWSGLSGIPIEAVTVNHGLRSEATQEAAFVGGVCDRLDIPHTILMWDGSKAVGNVQAAAREARYSLMQAWAKEAGVDAILLGHTLDDVAETFLMRLARKSGVDGLSVMLPQFRRDGIIFARPLWQSHREALRDYLRRHALTWVDDPSNEDARFDRVKARRALAALAPMGIDAEVLKSVALNMQSASTALEHYSVNEARRHVIFQNGDVVMPAVPRPPIPPETQRRLISGAVRCVSGAQYPPRETALIHLEAALQTQNRHTIGGCLVTKEEGMLRFSRELAACEDAVVWPDPTVAKLWDGRWSVTEGKAGNRTGTLTIRALGVAISDVPDWRAIGVPRASLMATPAIYAGDTLIAAPVAGYKNGFDARIVADFPTFLLSR